MPASTMPHGRVAFVGTDRWLSRAFARELATHYAEVVCVPPCPPGTVNAYGQARGETAGPPVVVLATWLDGLCEAPAELARMLAARVQTLERTMAGIGPVTLCIVPYGAFAAGAEHLLEFVAAREEEPSRPSWREWVDGLASTIAATSGPCRVMFTPMVLPAELQESTGYVSAAQKLIRVARCLTDEVSSKVPAYFSRYALSLRTRGETHLNVATMAQMVAAVAALMREPTPDPRSTPIHLEHAVSWHDFTATLADVSDLRLSSTADAADCNALDETFGILVSTEQDVDSDVLRCRAAPGAVRRVEAGELRPIMAAAGTAAGQPWESSYVAVHAIDVEDLVELRAKSCRVLDAAGAARGVAYRHGGAGPSVLVVTPFGIEPGYFTAIARELLADHEIIFWEPSGNETTLVERDAGDACAILRAEEVHDFHLVTWCGGVRLAAKLAEACGSRLRSMALFAPELDTSSNQAQGYRSLSRFFEQFARRALDAEEIAAKAREQWHERQREAPSANLDQYGAGTVLRKSPLQYHPATFDSPVGEGLFGDARRIVNMAQTVGCRGDVRVVLATLAAYEGPVLVIAGTADALIDYAGVRAHCERVRRWTLATVLGGNHYALLEHGPAIGRLLRRLIGDGAITTVRPDGVRGGRLRITVPRFAASVGERLADERVPSSAGTAGAGPGSQTCPP